MSFMVGLASVVRDKWLQQEIFLTTVLYFCLSLSYCHMYSLKDTFILCKFSILHIILLTFCHRICVDVLPADSTVNQSPAAKSQRRVRGRKVVITTGRSSRHDACIRPSVLPPRGRQAGSRSGGRSGRGCISRQQAVSVPATTTHVELDDDDEWEADDAEKIPQESAAERYNRLTAAVPRHVIEHDVNAEQINSGSLLNCCISLCHVDNDVITGDSSENAELLTYM